MVSNLEELGALLEENNITQADIEFIVKFMQNENISPQLAMRRIKAFETLKEKLESNEEKEKIALLEEELHQIKNQLVEKNQLLQDLQNEKSGLESQKLELESKSELIDSEREELQRQLEMIKDMQFGDEVEEEGIENQLLNDFIVQINSIIDEKNDLEGIFNPVKEALQFLINNNEIKLDRSKVIQEYEKIASKKSQGGETPPSTVSKPIGEDKAEKTVSQILAEKQRANQQPNQESMQKEEKTSSETKEVKEDKQDTSKQEKKDTKPKEPEKKVSEKEEQVLNLFLEFIAEAETDEGFKERVATICDMDEAYQYLGSIGLSQMYSFSSRGIEKKEELTQLLKSWKKEGIPR